MFRQQNKLSVHSWYGDRSGRYLDEFVEGVLNLSVTMTAVTTSTCPLKAAWCSAVRPERSDMFTLASSGIKYSAHFTALLAAATCSGVCQFLSRAFTSAE